MSPFVDFIGYIYYNKFIMKKTFVIELLLLFGFCMLLSCTIKLLDYVHTLSISIEEIKLDVINDPQLKDIIEIWRQNRAVALSYGIPALIAALATLAAIIIIAIKDFPVFKPLLDKLNAKRDARKQAKAEKAEADKQARIEQLQAELDELKKDE